MGRYAELFLAARKSKYYDRLRCAAGNVKSNRRVRRAKREFYPKRVRASSSRSWRLDSTGVDSARNLDITRNQPGHFCHIRKHVARRAETPWNSLHRDRTKISAFVGKRRRDRLISATESADSSSGESTKTRFRRNRGTGDASPACRYPSTDASSSKRSCQGLHAIYCVTSGNIPRRRTRSKG
jgi:hypothetical protein